MPSSIWGQWYIRLSNGKSCRASHATMTPFRSLQRYISVIQTNSRQKRQCILNPIVRLKLRSHLAKSMSTRRGNEAHLNRYGGCSSWRYFLIFVEEVWIRVSMLAINTPSIVWIEADQVSLKAISWNRCSLRIFYDGAQRYPY